MNPTLDLLTKRAHDLLERRSNGRQQEEDATRLCMILEDLCMAVREMNGEIDALRRRGTERALLNFTERKRR